MINTIDFITPPVDDPYWFGQIAAANAISDIYSMGGRPLTALNVVMFPSKHLDMGVLKEILRGGYDKVTEAGASLAGGHTVDDEEPKYGLSVNGVVHPDRIITNTGSMPEDALILTKPIGTGVLFNAVRSGKISYNNVERGVLPTVAMLNGRAMEAALEFELHACTDISGFGISGHLLEVVLGSNVRAILEYSRLSFYTGAMEMYKKGETTGSNSENRGMTKDHMEIKATLSKSEEELLYDPQTSGGLLLSVPNSQAEEMLRALSAAGVSCAARVGEIVQGPPGIVVV
jgi:selenide,water dikinase